MRQDTNALTGIRGVAAVWVLAFHFTEGLNLPFARLLSKGYLAVDLFFVLSGFVIAMNHGEAYFIGGPSNLCWSFWRRRITRVYPLFLIVLSVTLAHGVALGQSLPSLPVLLSNLTLTQAWFDSSGIVGPGWSVSAEAAAYLAFPWLASATFRKGWGFRVATVLASLACLQWLGTVDHASFRETDSHGPLDVHQGGVYATLRCL